jgi:hypothetical protein
MDRREGKRRKAEENSLKVFLKSGGEEGREGRSPNIISFFRRGSGDQKKELGDGSD